MVVTERFSTINSQGTLEKFTIIKDPRQLILKESPRNLKSSLFDSSGTRRKFTIEFQTKNLMEFRMKFPKPKNPYSDTLFSFSINVELAHLKRSSLDFRAQFGSRNKNVMRYSKSATQKANVSIQWLILYYLFFFLKFGASDEIGSKI